MLICRPTFAAAAAWCRYQPDLCLRQLLLCLHGGPVLLAFFLEYRGPHRCGGGWTVGRASKGSGDSLLLAGFDNATRALTGCTQVAGTALNAVAI